MPRTTANVRRVVTYEEVHVSARRSFLKEGIVDMGALADELAVSRSTLYRVVGRRDRLVGDVLATLAEEVLRRASREARCTGVDRIIEISKGFKEHVMSFEPFRAFLRSDPDAALRLLCHPAGGVHERLVRVWARIFSEAASTGELTLPFEPDELAYMFVRIEESALYSDILIGRDPDLEFAAKVQRILLRT